MGEWMRFVVFGTVINFWWLWIIIFILGIWKFIDLIILMIHHIK